MPKLGVWKTIKETIAYPFSHFGPVCRRASVVLLLNAVVGVLLTPWAMIRLGVMTVGQVQPGVVLLGVGLSIVLNLLMVVPVTALIRREFLHEASNMGWLHFRFGRDELLCLLGTLVYVLPVYMVMGILALGGIGVQPMFYVHAPGAAFVLSLVIMVTGAALIARLSPMSTMGALGLQPNPRQVWRLTRGNYSRFLLLVVVGLVLMFVVGAVGSLVSGIALAVMVKGAHLNPIALATGPHTLLLMPFGLVMQALSIGVVAGFLISVYRQMGGPVPAVEPAPGAVPAT